MEGRARSPRTAWIVLACALVVASVVRFHRLDLPLERDEGEYGYGARLILDGAFSYETLRTMKLPGVHLVVAPFVALFGDGPQALHLALLVFDAASVFVMFLLACEFLALVRAAWAAAVLAVTLLSTAVLGLYAHAEHFALLFVLSGLLFVVRAARGGGLFAWLASGLSFGVAFVMKQPAGLFGAFAAAALVFQLRARGVRLLLPRILVFSAAAAVPYGLVCAWMSAGGHFDAFRFMTVTYASAYGSGATWVQGWKHIVTEVMEVVTNQPAFALLGLVGLGALCARRELRRLLHPWLVVAVAGVIATSVGLYFRAHYFVLLLPVVAVAVVIGALEVAAWCARGERPRGRLAVGLVVGAALVGGWLERESLWTADPLVASRHRYFPNPFAESGQLAQIIRERTRPIDTVGILGSEPQIAFLSGRRSATGFVYMYPLLEEHEHAAWMQARAIEEIEAAKPRILVIVDVRISWLRRQHSVTRILDWYPEFVNRFYRPVGMFDLVSPDDVRWLDARSLAQERPPSRSAVYVFERVMGS